MSSCDFTIRDIRFRRRLDDECDIVVYNETVGTVTRRPDIANSAGGWYYVVHLRDDHRGPRTVDDRDAIKPAIARMLADRDLVPWTPPPVHPAFAANAQHPA